MYVCICNCLTERAVREAAAERRIGSADELFAALDVEPVCGHCMDFAEEIVQEAAHDNRAARPKLRVVNGG
jgi:bacterioferritin-associated ferredoxin